MNNVKYDINLINKYVEDGLLIKNEHKKYPIAIYNYSRTCQFEKKWDEVTLNMRGTVLDDNGNIIAKSFSKFFNWEELEPSDIQNEPFEVYEKLDGLLGLLFHYDQQWHLATRGSFDSEQAIKGKELLQKYNLSLLSPGYTYLFEILYDENRIVCNYDYEDIVMLACIDCSVEGIEVNIHNDYYQSNFNVVKRYDGINDYKSLKSLISDDREGYVVRFHSGFRMKIKGEEYVRLHRILTNFSNKDIWEMLKDGKDLESFLDRVPDEFDEWVKRTIKELRYLHYSIKERCGKIHDGFRYGKYGDVYPEPTKKEFAEYLKSNIDPYLHGILYSMWDNNYKMVDAIIWRMIKPKYEKPFWNKKEEYEK